MMNAIQNSRREMFFNDNKSFLNIVPASQFNPPSFSSNANGFQINEERTIVLIMQVGNAGTTPQLQKKISVYNLTSSNGIINNASELSFIGTTNELNFEISGNRKQLPIGFYWDSLNSKIYVRGTGDSIANATIAEFDFNLATLTATFLRYKTLDIQFQSGNFYFSENKARIFVCNAGGSNSYAEYALSIPGNISTATLVKIKSLDSQNCFAAAPVFYANGGYGFFITRTAIAGETNIVKRQFSVPYDYDTIITDSGYSQAFKRPSYGTGNFYSDSLQPIFISKDFRKINYFSASALAGGRIGVATFEIPANFKGNGNGLGGVKVGSIIIV